MKKTDRKGRGFSAKLLGYHELIKHQVAQRNRIKFIIVAVALFTSLVLVAGVSTFSVPTEKKAGRELIQTQHLNIFANGDIGVDDIVRLEVSRENFRKGVGVYLPAQARVEQALHRVGRADDSPIITADYKQKDKLLLVGDPNRFLAPDLHRFYINYSVSDLVDDSSGINRLLWPVTGELRGEIDGIFLNVNFLSGTGIEKAKHAKVHLVLKRNGKRVPLETSDYSRENLGQSLQLRVKRPVRKGEQLLAEISWARQARPVFN